MFRNERSGAYTGGGLGATRPLPFHDPDVAGSARQRARGRALRALPPRGFGLRGEAAPTRRKVFLLGPQVDARALDGRHAVRVLEVHDRLAVAERAGGLDLLDGVSHLEEPARAVEQI